MSAVGFFTPVYIADSQSIRDCAQNFVEGYFDLTSGLTLGTVLKVVSYVTLVIPAIVLAIKAYLRCSTPAQIDDAHLQDTHNPRATISFGENLAAFSGLLQKVQNLIDFEKIGFRNGVNSRNFCIGSDINKQHKIFIKSPMGKHVFIRQLRAKNEQLAFLISNRLELGVVPPTMALEGYRDTVEAVFPKHMLQHAKVGLDPQTYENSYAGVVIQEGILLEENQDTFDRNSLDREQVQKAVIFNLITRRVDAGRNNTVIAQSGKMMELDNEKLGESMSSDSWLLSDFAEMTFGAEVINNFLSKPIHTVRYIFEEMEMFNFDQRIKTNIIGNFDKVREFFTLHKDKQAKVKDLTAFLKNP